MTEKKMTREKTAGIALAALLSMTTLAATHKAGETRTIVLPGGATLELVWCPPGSFTMGSPDAEDGNDVNEDQHRVTLTKGFWIGRYEVTQQQWDSVMGSTPTERKDANRPVSRVSWTDCQEFCRTVGGGLRLPTEAEWEYACRAGSTTAYFWGNALNGDRANCDGGKPCGTKAKGPNRRQAVSVGSYAPNAWGIHDMHGNVAEWCSDWLNFHENDATDPTGPISGDCRVIRGGGWCSSAEECRAACCKFDHPGSRDAGVGFRVCCFGDGVSASESVGSVPVPQKVCATASPSVPQTSRKAGETCTVTLPGGAKLELVWCPPGAFAMGSPVSEAGRYGDETQHRVTLTRGFWLGKYEVTQRQWESVMGTNPAHFKDEDKPVECVSWIDGREFCRMAGLGLRLPTEAEWEYACRAGSTTAYAWGDALDGVRASCNGNRPCGTTTKGPSQKETASVGAYAPNAWGIHDMHGNVFEWCDDRYAAYAGDVLDPSGGRAGTRRVIRGGGWSSSPCFCRSAYRLAQGPANRDDNTGFRVCCTEVLRVVPFAPPVVRAATPSSTSKVPREAGATRTVSLPGGAELELVWCPPGSFIMGSPEGVQGVGREWERSDDEVQHRVTLTRGFWMGRYEVTQRQWKSVMGSNPSCCVGEDRPVENVSWRHCQSFCRKAGLGLRLPTEAEWEYACRAGSTTAFFWGSVSNGDRANCDGGDRPYGTSRHGVSWGKTMRAGRYAANAWGICDMHGNVLEWCADWKADYPRGAVIDPTGPTTGDLRVRRGGSFCLGAGDCRSAKRDGDAPDAQLDSLGFRVCCFAE